jgi:hypothetical protein
MSNRPKGTLSQKIHCHYGALLAGARELKENGTSRYAEGGASSDVLKAAFN